MSALIQKHLDALEATMRLGLAQIDAARHACAAESVPTVRVSTPDRCADVPEERCAMREGEWVSRGTLADPHRVKCQGCGHEQSAGVQ